jgi:SAM-dependent methyltransferase
MEPKEYYKNYLADNEVSRLSHRLVSEILSKSPNSVLEFGCGTGKNLKEIKEKSKKSVSVFGIDVSLIGIQHGNIKNELDYLALGDQDWLSRIFNMDVVFTCSVLDHIENVSDIIKQMQRIASHVFLAETNDVPDKFYYPHDYESFGFVKLPFEWVSDGDGSTYYIWHWQHLTGGEHGNSFAHDDLGKPY